MTGIHRFDVKRAALAVCLFVMGNLLYGKGLDIMQQLANVIGGETMVRPFLYFLAPIVYFIGLWWCTGYYYFKRSSRGTISRSARPGIRAG